MSQKIPRNQRRKLAAEAAAAGQPAKLTPGEVFRRRRNKRLILVGVVAVGLPLLEVIAYQFRSIFIVVVNRSDEVVTDVKFTYPGGSFEAKELKAGGELTKVIRPNFSFTRDEFSTYRATISFVTGRGAVIRQPFGRYGTVDYSARETFAIQAVDASGIPGLKHSTYPGFPLGTVRDLLTKLRGG